MRVWQQGRGCVEVGPQHIPPLLRSGRKGLGTAQGWGEVGQGRGVDVGVGGSIQRIVFCSIVVDKNFVRILKKINDLVAISMYSHVTSAGSA